MTAHFGSRLRKGAVTTTVAALAVAALTASQAPDVLVEEQGRPTTTGAQPTPDFPADDTATGNSRYYTDLPPLKSPNPAPTTGTTPPAAGQTAGEAGVPATVLDAYQKAAAELARSKPGCNMPWELLAAIGQVESGQARGGKVDANGTTIGKILGPKLNGNGFAHIQDTDHGAYDGDTTVDRAVGPMQFIPSTWAWAGRDGNGDGVEDPNNIYDAALAAGHYLCRNDWDMATDGGLHAAILSYNNSTEYLNLVLTWLDYYRKGAHEIPDGTGPVPSHPSDETPAGGSTPPATPSPSTSPRPGTPPAGNGNGSASPNPGTPTPQKPTTPATPSPTPTPPTPTDTVDHLENAGPAKLSAMAGDAFAPRISTRAETASGSPVAKVRIRFTIAGDTDTTFAGGETVATVITNSAGVAVAPVLQAGEKTGAFTVRATVVGRILPGVSYAAAVTARAADTLTRTGDTALTCTPGGEFADQVEVKATYKGAAADRVAATATLIKSADDPTANDKGPYFKDADGKPVRTLTALETDANGLLKLPKLYADDTTGTFLLRITTTGGATLTVELTVAAAQTSPSPSPSTSPTESTSPSPSASPSA
ncbi:MULTISPECIES: lytic transglycosylase domain-containing protein [Streptomyces]|uniref:Lytic transglycosylase n=2 Tax=Streptomyces TaxID=1883 RepID=A0A2U9NYU4_STRAS|nr:lytic transglycosylase domain-containing protein [Streptomyces actuosus]AWT42506.1 lytic transglycosylase [Streptomyces actuosus]MBM4819707.1 lytic transglycosylase domain-containing protein [Streptomyces actuosus]